jgi:hypothetical protein
MGAAYPTAIAATVRPSPVWIGVGRGNPKLMSTDDFDATAANDIGGANDMLSPMEATDSDDVRNADGDDVVDPPDHWSGADKFGMSSQEQAEGETLDQRLAEEVPDITPDDVDPRDADDTVDVDVAVLGSDVAPPDPGVHGEQVDGVPEDGDSLFPVVE